jgi:hypothetical protein
MRAFVRLREITAHHKDLASKIDKLERGHSLASSVIRELAEDIDALAHRVDQLETPPPKPQAARIDLAGSVYD